MTDKKCSVCDGTGWVKVMREVNLMGAMRRMNSPCPNCNGTGTVEECSE